MAKDEKKAEYMKQYRARKKAPAPAHPQAPRPQAPRRSSSDPVGEWMAKAAADNALSADVLQRFLKGEVTHKEAQKLWFDAHKDQNAWGDLL